MATSARAVLVVLAMSAPAFAQTTVESFPELPQVLKKGNVVFVQDEKGERTKGKIMDLTDARLTIETPGVVGHTRVFLADRVMRVSRVDSRLNGFLIGAAIGVAGGIYSGSMIDMLFENEASNADWAYPVFASLMGFAGGGIGYAIDGAIDGQTLVFARRSAGPPAQVRLAPMIGRHGGGAMLSIRF